MVTAVIGMSLPQICFKVSEYNESFTDFRGKRFELFRLFREHVSCNLVCRRLIDSVELSVKHSTFLLVTISRI